MGACGTAMGNAAILLKRLGHDVLGADSGAYPPMSDLLSAEEIVVFEGYDAERLAGLHPDLIVVGNAVTRGNPEVEWLLESNRIPYTSLPELIGREFLKDRKNIVITGTHGKTTTAALTAWLLRENGIESGYLLGGVSFDLEGGANNGDLDEPFVIEGDEYDCAFFDKRSKFIHYRPSILVINNLEFDHCDIFRDMVDLRRAYSHLLRIMPRNGYVLVNGDDRNVALLMPVEWTTILKVGVGEENDLLISDYREDCLNSSFSLLWKGRAWDSISWALGGMYNARNAAMAALAAGLSAFPRNPARLSLTPLTRALGVKRRQETLLEGNRLKVIEDFGHHPTAIGETLQSLRVRHPSSNLTACFEPRSNTSRRNVFQDEFRGALEQADTVLIGPVNRGEELSSSERLDTLRLARELRDSVGCAKAFASNRDLLEELISRVEGNSRNDQLICFFSNGSFDGIIGRFVSELSVKESVDPDPKSSRLFGSGSTDSL